jgi:hypothetical protein
MLLTQCPTAVRNMPDDPEHDLDDVIDQIDGPCQGFVRDFAQHYPRTNPDERSEIMSYYGHGTLSVLHSLAESLRYATAGSLLFPDRLGPIGSSSIAGPRLFT